MKSGVEAVKLATETSENYPKIIKLAYRVKQHDRQARLLRLFVEEVRRTGRSEYPELASYINKNK